MKITMKCLLALLLIGTKPLLKLDKSRQATHTDYNPNGLSRIMKYNISQKQ